MGHSGARSLLAGFIIAVVAAAVSSASSADSRYSRCNSGQTLMRGDVDGDGAPDRVQLVGRWREGRGCSYVLTAKTREGSSSLRLREGLLEADVDPSAKWVHGLYGFAGIDSRPGHEVLVLFDAYRIWHAGIYAYREGHLRHLPRRGGRYTDALFSAGGGANVVQVTDCWRGPDSGLIISSSQVHDWQTRWIDVSRAVLREERGSFRPVWRRTYRVRENRFQEFRGAGTQEKTALFRSCKTRG